MRERTLTVTQLNEYVKGVFEDELMLHDINVTGEVFEFKNTPSACFLTLKDGGCQLNCVSFDGNRQLSVGNKVSLFGSVKFYAKTGKISFVFKSVQTLGEGVINAEFEALKQRLLQEGLFAANKPIPSPVQSVALITAQTGAVLHDFVKTVYAHRRFTDIHVFSSLVQGELAADDLIENIRAADKKNYDLIVIARGGGSAEDLSVFNNEKLVRAVAAARTPVISAVGHETDYTLCDFAASVRAGTPSIAGELIASSNERFFERFYNAINLLQNNVLRAQTRASGKLIKLATGIAYIGKLKLQSAEHKIDIAANSIAAGVNAALNRNVSRVWSCAESMRQNAVKAHERGLTVFKESAAKLENGNPLRILATGYGKLYNNRGAVTSVDDVKVNDDITVALRDGTVYATVNSKRKIGGNNET